MKEWFKARNNWGAAIFTLSDAEAGRLMKALWQYTMTGEQTNLSGAEKGIFALILLTLSQDEERDSEISEKRALAGSLGGKQRVANESKSKQGQANASASEANEANALIRTRIKNKNKEQEKDILFDRFWAAYPRHDTKAEARKVFDKLNPDEDLLAVMLAAIEQQKKSNQWSDPRFIPQPRTWLNQKRWEDETPQASPDKPQQPKRVVAQDYEQRDYSGEDSLADVLSILQGDMRA